MTPVDLLTDFHSMTIVVIQGNRETRMRELPVPPGSCFRRKQTHSHWQLRAPSRLLPWDSDVTMTE
jgi:hypothetical protein